MSWFLILSLSLQLSPELVLSLWWPWCWPGYVGDMLPLILCPSRRPGGCKRRY